LLHFALMQVYARTKHAQSLKAPGQRLKAKVGGHRIR
jgi:hypothetical protein